MKKKMAAFLIAGFVALSIAACGGSGNSGSSGAVSSASGTGGNSAAGNSAAAVTAGGSAAAPEESDTSDPLSADMNGKGVKIGFVVKDLSSQYWNLMRVGAEDAAKKYGAELTFIAPNSESDVQKQVENIETVISKGVDVLCIAPSNDETVLPSLKNAVNAGIKVIAVDTDSSLKDKLSFIGTGNKEAAENGARWAAEQVGSGKKAIILRGRLGDKTHDLREEGIKAGLKAGGVEIVETQAADSSEEKALQITENLLNKYPDLALIITTADPMSTGAFNALKHANNKNALVYGFNGDTPVCEQIEKGTQMLGSTAQLPYNMGVLGVQNAIKAARGEKLDQVIDSGSEVISKDNARAYLDKINKLSGD